MPVVDGFRYKIYKYELETTAYLITTFKAPKVINTLKIDLQDDKVCLWCVVDLSTKEQKREVVCFPTGAGFHNDPRETNFNTDYIDSVVMPNNLVWHFCWHNRGE